MKIWLSSEVEEDASEALRQAEVKVKRAINSRLAGDYGHAVDEWAIITILRPQIPDGWGEVYRYHRRRRVAEFRLIIDYDEFRSADADQRVAMLLRSILRSLDIFPRLGVVGFDVERFRRDILDVARSEGWATN